MAKKVATSTLLGLLAVFVLVVVSLPWLRMKFGYYFPEGFQGYPSTKCDPLCNEGQFCQDQKCHSISAPVTNEVMGA